MHMKRIRRWLLWVALAFLLVSVTPVILLRWLPPVSSAVMLERRLTERASQDYQWLPIEQISPYIALAVVASEDQKFPTHYGFDFVAIKEAVVERQDGARLRGASTLTQQVAKNLFLWQGHSFIRKGLEAWMTVLLELFWPKQRILEVYLNIAETGNRTFGMQAASLRYFSVPANALTPEQAALLAAILPNPRKMKADRPSEYVLGRRDSILQLMCDLGGVHYLHDILPDTLLATTPLVCSSSDLI
jgi:monofunctional glycosyltransferase